MRQPGVATSPRRTQRTHLSAQGVCVRYGSALAVNAADVAVEGGCILAISGESGAGKSSLLWALAGAVPTSAGAVLLDGCELRSAEDALARGVRLMPQTNGLAGVLTAVENVEFPLLDRSVSPPEARERASAALGDVGLDGFEDHLVDELSGGQQQRVALARLLAAEPRILLADEPTSALDHVNRERVLTLLRRAADRGAVVVVTTHDADVAAAADERWVMHEGVLSPQERSG